MKKQFQILVVTFITVAFISCSKDKMEMPEAPAITKEEIATSSSSNRPYIDPLTIGLEARFEFNGNLKNQIRGVADGVPSRRVPSYGPDRKGIFKSALYLDGAYSVKLNDVPQQTNTSLSVWVKTGGLLENNTGGIVTNQVVGPRLLQSADRFLGTVGTVTNTPGGYADILNTTWHHVVVTYDGAYMRLYVDNTLKVVEAFSGTIAPTPVDYVLGWSSVWQVLWNGYIDDLRFYSRTLSASDVQKLYNL